MKKFLVFLIMVLSIPLIVKAESEYKSKGLEDTFIEEGINYELYNYKQGSGKVNVYLFRGQGCSHCRSFLGYVRDTLVPELGDKFNLISYEVWNDENNLELLKNVINYVGAPENTGIPFIVIGDKYYAGFSEAKGELVKKAIEETYKNNDNKDAVKDVIAGKKKKSDDSGNVDSSSVIITVILCSFVLGGLYIFKSNYDKNILLERINNVKKGK